MNSKTAGNEFSQVIDNFLPEDHFKNLYDFFMGTGMIWNYNDMVDYPGENEDQFQFTHTFFTSYEQKVFVSPLSDVVRPFLDLLKPNQLHFFEDVGEHD